MITVTKGGVTLASATGSQEELEQAIGLSAEEISANRKQETEAASAAAHAQEQGLAENDSDSETETDESQAEQSPEERQKRKGSRQRRIEKLTKRTTELEETLQEERLARQRLEARLAGKPAKDEEEPKAAVIDANEEPTEEGLNPKTGKPWKDWREFNRSHTEWVMDQRTKSAETARANQSDQQQVEENWKAHTTRLAEAQEKYEDWTETAESLAKLGEQNISIPQPVALAIIELENGPDVLYKLAKEPELIQKLQKMSEVRAIAEIGRIAAALPQAEPSDDEKDGQKTAKADSPTKPRSAAPDPIKPVGGAATTSKANPEKLTLSDYIRQRNAGLIK